MTASSITVLRRLLGADPGDKVGRGRERLLRIALSAASALVSRMGTILVLLITVPMARELLGPERFGMWMVLSSLTAVLAFADLGIGNGILSITAEGLGLDEPTLIREATSSGLTILAFVGLAMLVGVVALRPMLDWPALFQVHSARARAEAWPAVAVLVSCFALGLPAGVGSKVQAGLQVGYVAEIWNGVGGFTTLFAVVVGIKLGAGLPALVLALFAAPPLAQLVNSLFFFARRPDIRPRAEAVHRMVVIRMFKLGGMFFALQVVGVLAFRIDTVLVTQFFGPIIAGRYAVYERIFSLLGMVSTLCLAPLWPAYAEALGRGDINWVKRIVKLSLVVAPTVTLMLVAPLVLAYEQIITFWTGAIMMPFAIVVGMAVWRIMETTGISLTMFLNGVGVLKPQLAMAVAMLGVGLALKFALAPRLGPQAIIWSTIVSYGGIVLIPTLWIMARKFRELDRSHSGGN